MSYDGHFQLRRLLVILLVAGIVFHVVLITVVIGRGISVVTIGEAIGGGASMALLPTLAAGPWRLVQLRRGALNNGPAILAGAVFMFVAFVVAVGALVSPGA